MSPTRLKSVSRRLTWLLRHGANEAELVVDAEGFASIPAVMRLLGVDDPADIAAIVAADTKQRFEVRGDTIRAVQGHSLKLDGLEASWTEYTGAGTVYHGTTAAAAQAILTGPDGIVAMARSHVHMAPTRGSKVGKRANVEVLLHISVPALRALGIPVFSAPNGVVLAARVPRCAITRCDLLTPESVLALAPLYYNNMLSGEFLGLKPAHAT